MSSLSSAWSCRSLASASALVMLALVAGPAAGQSPAPSAKEAKPGAATAVASPAVASTPVKTTATYGNWVLHCVQMPASAPDAAAPAKAGEAVRACEVVQTVQVQGQPQPIAQIAIGRLPADKALVMTAILPVNVSLPGLVQISGNGKTGAEEKGRMDLAWQRCQAGGCIATARPDAATLGLLRSGTQGQLRLADATGNLVAIPLSWVGLDQALAALDKAP